MKLNATIVVGIRAASLADAGRTLDAILEAARAGDDVQVTSVEVRTPPASAVVTLPSPN